MAAREHPYDGDATEHVRSGQARADDAELKGHLSTDDPNAMRLVDELASQQGTGPAPNPEFRQGLRERLIAEMDKGDKPAEEG